MFGLLQIWENVSEMLFLSFLRKQQEAHTDFCIISKKIYNYNATCPEQILTTPSVPETQ
jgi:hypothetical protein